MHCYAKNILDRKKNNVVTKLKITLLKNFQPQVTPSLLEKKGKLAKTQGIPPSVQ